MDNIVESTVDNKRAANFITKLGQLEVSLTETPWYRLRKRKALQDQINHLVWNLFLWSVSYKKAALANDELVAASEKSEGSTVAPEDN
ncbi:MAG: hypothetical protein JRN21_09415 [Nitrososphaerota archaeon]|nr:hypothetical protein [Nitrososphaerota archaeon]